MSPPGDNYREKKEKISWAKGEMAKFYVKAVAEDSARLVQLLGDIPDAARRSEAIAIISQLIMHARGEAEFGMPSPADDMLTKLQTEPARSKNPQQAEQRRRRERLWPYVKERATKFPLESPTKIITKLLIQNDFKALFTKKKAPFKAARRTLDADAAALLKDFQQT